MVCTSYEELIATIHVPYEELALWLDWFLKSVSHYMSDKKRTLGGQEAVPPSIVGENYNVRFAIMQDL